MVVYYPFLETRKTESKISPELMIFNVFDLLLVVLKFQHYRC